MPMPLPASRGRRHEPSDRPLLSGLHPEQGKFQAQAEELFRDFMGRDPDPQAPSSSGPDSPRKGNAMSTNPQVLAWITCDSVYADPRHRKAHTPRDLLQPAGQRVSRHSSENDLVSVVPRPYLWLPPAQDIDRDPHVRGRAPGHHRPGLRITRPASPDQPDQRHPPPQVRDPGQLFHPHRDRRSSGSRQHFPHHQERMNKP